MPKAFRNSGLRRGAPALLPAILRRLALAFALALAGHDASAAPAEPEHAAAAETAAYAALFNSREIKSATLTAFKQWLSVMDRYAGERKLENGPCTDADPIVCHLAEWHAFLTTLKGKDRMAQLQEVNRYMNAHPYILDIVNWGVADYWETPKEFFDRNGDCEDYAISKFYSLRALGMDNANMRIVVLQDMNLQIPHAVLVAYLDGKPYVLDNQIPEVVSADIIRHYRPFYSINEKNWWLHRPN